MELIEDFIAWYVAPWGRMDRKEFALVLTLASLPGVLFWLIGFGDTLAGIPGMFKNLSSMDVQGMMAAMNGGGAAKGFHVDWAGVVNNLCFLITVPACAMRLRDMGYLNRTAWVLSAIINVYVVEALVISLSGYDVVPFGWGFTILSFAGYTWLTFARGKPRMKPSERIPGPEAYREPRPDPQPNAQSSPFVERDDDGY